VPSVGVYWGTGITGGGEWIIKTWKSFFVSQYLNSIGSD
jgi:hypothetical protein